MMDATTHGGHISTPSNTTSHAGSTQRGGQFVQTSIIVKDEVHTRQDNSGKAEATQTSLSSTTYSKEELLALSKLPFSLIRPPDLPALYCRDEPGNLVEQRQARPERRPKPQPPVPGQSSTPTAPPSKAEKSSWSRSERDKYKHPGHFEMSEKDRETFGVDVVGPTGFLSPATIDLDKRLEQDKNDDEIILSPPRKQFPSTQLTKDKDPSAPAPRDSKRDRTPRSAHQVKEGHVYAVKSPRKPDEKEGEQNQKSRYQPKTTSPTAPEAEPENPDKENTPHKTRAPRQDGVTSGPNPKTNKTKQPPTKPTAKKEQADADQQANAAPAQPQPQPQPPIQSAATEQPNMLKLLGGDEYNPKYIDNLFSTDENLVDHLFKNQITKKEQRHFSWIATGPDEDDHSRVSHPAVVPVDGRNAREAEKANRPNPDKDLLSSLAFERWFSTPQPQQPQQPQPALPQQQPMHSLPPHMQPAAHQPPQQGMPLSALENSWGMADNNPLAALFKNASLGNAAPQQDGSRELRRSLEPAFSATTNPTAPQGPKPSDFGPQIPHPMANGMPNMMPNVMPHQMNQPNRAKTATPTPQPMGPMPGMPSQAPRTPQKNEQQHPQKLPQQQPQFAPAPYATMGAKPPTPQPMYGPNPNDPLLSFFQSLSQQPSAQAMLAQQGYPGGYPPALLMQPNLNILQTAQLQSMLMQQQQQAQQAQHMTSPQKYGARPQQRAPHVGPPAQLQQPHPQLQPGRDMYGHGIPMHPGMMQPGGGGLEKWFGNGILNQQAAANPLPVPGKLMTLEELESKMGKQ